MVLTIFLFNLLFAGCFSMNNPYNNSDILFFENYSYNKFTFPKKNLLRLKEMCFTDSILVNHKILLQAQNNKITGELFDILCNLDVINHWYIYKKFDKDSFLDYNYEEFVKRKKQEIELFYLGKLKFSKSFDSFLFVSTTNLNDFYFTLKEVFLINVKNNAVVSTTRMCSYTNFEGNAQLIFTVKKAGGTFIQKEETISSDIIIPEGMQFEKEEIAIEFTYDRKGRLKKI